MEVSYAKIYGTSHKFKLCEECEVINWHENNECFNCSCNDFKERDDGITETLDKDYKYYEDEGYDEDEIDGWEVEV